jgi:hypothetical protein
MFRRRDEIRRRLENVIEKFRQQSAVSPETAKTPEELGLPPRFQEAMKRRLGRSGIFVEVNGKYYLDEERLKQIQEQRLKIGSGSNAEGGWKRAEKPGWSRYIGILLMLPIGLIVAIALFYLLVFSGVSFFPGEFLIILTIVMVVVAVIRILFWRSRRRHWHEQWGRNTS